MTTTFLTYMKAASRVGEYLEIAGKRLLARFAHIPGAPSYGLRDRRRGVCKKRFDILIPCSRIRKACLELSTANRFLITKLSNSMNVFASSLLSLRLSLLFLRCGYLYLVESRNVWLASSRPSINSSWFVNTVFHSCQRGLFFLTAHSLL